MSKLHQNQGCLKRFLHASCCSLPLCLPHRYLKVPQQFNLRSRHSSKLFVIETIFNAHTHMNWDVFMEQVFVAPHLTHSSFICSKATKRGRPSLLEGNHLNRRELLLLQYKKRKSILAMVLSVVGRDYLRTTKVNVSSDNLSLKKDTHWETEDCGMVNLGLNTMETRHFRAARMFFHPTWEPNIWKKTKCSPRMKNRFILIAQLSTEIHLQTQS